MMPRLTDQCRAQGRACQPSKVAPSRGTDGLPMSNQRRRGLAQELFGSTPSSNDTRAAPTRPLPACNTGKDSTKNTARLVLSELGQAQRKLGRISDSDLGQSMALTLHWGHGCPRLPPAGPQVPRLRPLPLRGEGDGIRFVPSAGRAAATKR